MTVQVESTRLAANQIAALRGRVKIKLERFLDDLASRGCGALRYRLTGDVVERLCVAHIYERWRVVVAFRTQHNAAILLVGEHADDDPGIDVYTKLYELAGITVPPAERRTKPPCCDDAGVPPQLKTEEIDALFQQARNLVPRRR